MANPLILFSGAALATLAALLGVTSDKWKDRPVSAPGAQVSAGSADAASTGPASVTSEKQDATSADAPAAGAAAPPETQTAAVAPEQPLGAEPTPPASAEPAPDDSKPSFDTIRVESDGTAVMAGRGLPNSEVAILFNDKSIGSAKTDAFGAWVLVPTEPLPVGDYQVTLRMQQVDAAPVFSEQSVALKVPERGTDQALVVLSEQNQASRVLQQPKAAAEAVPAEPTEATAEAAPAKPAEPTEATAEAAPAKPAETTSETAPAESSEAIVEATPAEPAEVVAAEPPAKEPAVEEGGQTEVAAVRVRMQANKRPRSRHHRIPGQW